MMSELGHQLIDFCLKKELAQVEHLLDEGAQPNELLLQDLEVTSALHLVCGKVGDLDLLKVLTRNACNVDIRDFKGCTPLHYACSNGHSDLVSYLIQELDCNPSVKANNGQTSLHMACSFRCLENEHLKVVQFLTNEVGCDCNVATNKGETPLMLLCNRGTSKQIAEHLVHTCHCDTTLKDNDGNTALHLACTCPSLEFVKLIIEHGSPPDLSLTNSKLNTPLHLACLQGRIEIVKVIVTTTGNCGMHSLNDQNCTPMEVALAEDYLEIASFLIRKMYEKRDADENTPLHIACMKENTKLLDHIKKIRGPSSVPNQVGDTPLHIACRIGNSSVVAKLLKMKCDILAKNLKGETAIHIAIQHDHWSIVQKIWNCPFTIKEELQLIKSLKGVAPQSIQPSKEILHYACGASGGYSDLDAVKVLKQYYSHSHQLIDHRDELNGLSPLHYACGNGRYDVVEYLINEYKPNVKKRTRKGNTALHLACEGRNPSCSVEQALKIVKYLITIARCDPNATATKSGNTPLMDLAHHYNMDRQIIAHYLIFDCHSDLMMQNTAGNTALHIACLTGNNQVVQMIADHENGRRLFTKTNKEGNTPLHLACREGKLDVVKGILSLVRYPGNCGLYVLNKNGCTPLQVAIVNNRYEVMSALIQVMDLQQDKDGNTLLHDACKKEDILLTHCLARSRCYLNMQNEDGNTPLHIACQNDNYQLCEILLEVYCDINVKNKEGNTPLRVAFSNGNFEIAQLLISDPRIKTDLRNNVGDTLLHCACKSQHCTSEMVNYVLAIVKSDPNSINKDGMTPIQLTSNDQIIHELIRYGASPADVYSTNNVHVSKHPPQPLVKVFVVGNPSVGKSTLIAALQRELSRIVKVFTPARKVSGVDEKTAGVIPYEFESKKYGQVTLYDFAGQREFYSSHAALLQNSIESSPPVFLIVVNLCESYEEIKQSILYWLSFLENQCTSVGKESKPHVIIIGSHADVLELKGENIDEKLGIIDLIQSLPHFNKSMEMVSFVAMNCQYSQSSGMRTLRQKLQDSCKRVRIKDEIRFNTRCFLVYLLDKFRDSKAVILSIKL